MQKAQAIFVSDVSLFLLDSQEAWGKKSLNQHLTWLIKIRPCKEPVNSSLAVIVCMIFLVGVPVIIMCP